MAQSYTRQSTFADGDTISASLFNNEYNQLLNSFAYSSTSEVNTGHRHDGTAGQGGNIFKIGDLDFLNKIEVDGTNNRLGFYVEVSSAAVEQIRIQDGAIVPVTDNDIDLGTSSLEFKDIYIDGTANLDSLVLGSGSTVTAILDEDNLSSNSATALATQQSIKAYVDAQVTAQDFDFSADSGGALSIDLDSESMTFTGGTGIDTSGSGNAVTFAIDSTVATLTGSQTLTNKTLTSPDINGGTIDGATIATSDITVGTGKTLDVSAGTLTLADNQISGNKVEGGTIAATTITDLTFGSLNDGTITVTAFVDEDNMSSDSATLVPTQQSVKAYVDSQVTAQDLDLTTDSGTIAIDLDSETLTVSGGTGIDSSATGNAVTLAIDSTVATLTGSQTLSNKTLATPVVSGNLTTDGLIDGRDVATDGTKLDGIEALADVTDTANVTAAGALMDSELTSEASVKALNQGVATTDSPTFTNLTLNGTGSVKVPAGTTAQRDGSPAAGMFRYNSSLAQFEGYTDAWGAIGGGGTNTFTTDSFTGNGSTTAYALSQSTASEDNLLVFIEGVFQQQDAYSIATAGGVTTLTFSSAPANGNSILIYSVAAGVSGSNLNIDSMTGDGSDTTLTLSINPVNENNTQVFIDGVYQSKSNYSISGTTLTFSTAPPNGSAVEVMTMTQTDINVPVDGTITSAKLSGDLVTPGALDVTGTVTADAANIGGTIPASPDGVLAVRSDSDAHAISIYEPAGANENWQIGVDADGDLGFYNSGSTTAAVTVNDSNNVGIGTSSVSNDLHIKGAGAAAIRLEQGNGSNYGLIKQNQTSQLLQLGVGGSFGINIDSSNKIGIGTSAPERTLHVDSAAVQIGALISSTSTVAARLSLMDANTTNSASVGIGATGDNLGLYAGGVEKVTLDSGNVTVNNAGAGNGIITINGATGSTEAVIFQRGGTEASRIGHSNSADLTFSTGSGATERMRLDASGNLYIGKSVTTYNTEGAFFERGAALELTTDGGRVLRLNRTSTDGNILEFNKGSGTTVGSIGAYAGDLTIGDDDVGIRFDTGTGLVPWDLGANSTGGAATDGAIDIGAASARFKDLYLSNAVHATHINLEDAGGTYRTALDYDASSNLKISTGASAGSRAITFFTENAEQMRLDASGNLLVGTTDTTLFNNTSGGGINLMAANRLDVARAGDVVATFNRMSDNGQIIQFYQAGVQAGSIGTNSGYIYIANNDGDGMALQNNSFRPATDTGANQDNVIDLGLLASRFDDIYATNGTIQTSDANEKQDIEALSDAEQRVAVAAKGLLRKFRWISSVEENGDDARIHFGIIAQDLQAAFEAEGLDAGRYAMFISSTWTDEDGNEQTRLGVRYSELLAFIISAI